VALLWVLAGCAAPRSYDVLVYGGTPQGVSCAVAAARQGLRVVLVSPTPEVGGQITRAWVATLDLARDSRGRPLQGGLFAEFHRRMGGRISLDVGQAEAALQDMLRQSGAELFTGWQLFRVDLDQGRAGFLTEQGRRSLAARFFVDASDTARLALAAGAPFTTGREDTGLDSRCMAASLIFSLRGVDWHGLQRLVAEERRRYRNNAGMASRTVWGLGRLASGYTPSDPTRFHLRGLNCALQDEGQVLVNALILRGLSPDADLEALRDQVRPEVERVVDYLRRAAPGAFGAARLEALAPALYVRESRHLVGLYRMHAEDLLYGRDFPDGVAVGGYPLDGQTYGCEPPYLLGTPAPYAVPLRALIPRGFQRLLVVSQAASFDSTAAFSTRVVPLQMALGEAAGLACAVALQHGLDFPALAERPAELRRRILAENGRLDLPLVEGPPDLSHPGYAAAVDLLRRGLFNASYRVQGRLELYLPVTAAEFLSSLEHFCAARRPQALPQVRSCRLQLAGLLEEPLSRATAREILRACGFASELPSSAEALSRGEAALELWRHFSPLLGQR
jgi:hypothetical protein